MNSITSIFFEIPSKIIYSYIKARKDKNNAVIYSVNLGLLFYILAIVTIITSSFIYPEKQYPDETKIILIIFFALLLLGSISFSTAILYDEKLLSLKKEELIIEKEKNVAENPNEPTLAWDLARIKLESYLNRNLQQVKSIYYWSIFVMFLGFGLIIFASYMAFIDTTNFSASLIAAISGVITNFIGATFLFIYKSIVQQSENYVKVLERINAVGMSVQVIESISDSNLEIKEKAKAEIAIKLIEIYNNK